MEESISSINRNTEVLISETSSCLSFDMTESSSSISEICEEEREFSLQPLDLSEHGLLKINSQTYAFNCKTGSFDNKLEKETIKSGPMRLPLVSNDLAKTNKILDKRENSSINEKKNRNQISICICNTRYNLIKNVAIQLGFRIVKESDLWNICWTDSICGVEMFKDMKRFQKINHFPGMFEICRKDLLARHLNRMLRLYPSDYQIFPRTWVFPADLGEAIAYSKQYRNKTFILKPDTGAQGRGIWLTKDLKDIKPTDRMICQVYITKPLLIDGFKFDLRVYALITSTDPLSIYIYNEGLARFATTKYRLPDVQNASNHYMHLTNYSVNKHSGSFSKDDEAGSKRKFSSLNKILSTEGYDIDQLWTNIDDIIVKTVISAWPMLKHNYNACFPSHDIIQACFEILGFDIIIDHNMKPYILEVNHSPSFHTAEPVDTEVKEALIKDTFILLNISNDDKRKVIDEDKRRVKNRLIKRIHDSSNSIKDLLDVPKKTNLDTNENEIMEYENPWTRQLIWEESHLGNFRRVMPCPGDSEKYSKYCVLQNQASVYGNTTTSKIREAYAKKQRNILAEKAIKNQLLLNPKFGKMSLQMNENIENGSKKIKRNKLSKPLIGLNNNWESTKYLLDIEERERILQMTQRNFLIKSCGLIPYIYVSFFKQDMLSNKDRIKYSEMFNQLTTTVPESEKLLPNCVMNVKGKIEKLPLIPLISDFTDPSGISCIGVPLTKRPTISEYVKKQMLTSTCYHNNKATAARQVSNNVRKNIFQTKDWIDKLS